MFDKSKFLVGNVEHRRIAVKRHRLRYRVFSLLLDLDKLPETDRTSRLFSHNRWNLISLFDCDLADGKTENLRQFVEGLMSSQLPEIEYSKIWLLTYPRVFGYVFNPLSVYFCLDDKRQAVAAIYEVSNTFGDRTHYVQEIVDGMAASCQKRMVVSPFNKSTGEYSFPLKISGDGLSIGVSLWENSNPVLKTWFRAKPKPLNDMVITRLLLSIPVMTLKVIAAIHFEALKLWLKGLRTPKQLQARNFKTYKQRLLKQDNGS